MRVEDIVKKKGDDVVTLGVDATLRDLVQTLAAHRIGAALVMDGADLAGIVSERDVVRHLAADATLDAPVTEFMPADVQTCVRTDEIQKLATLMTERRFRHLPVLEDGAVIAIVSLGAPRRFGLRALAGGDTRWLTLCGGDLLVMGGRCQHEWQHTVPKEPGAGPRISVTFRHGDPGPVTARSERAREVPEWALR